MPKIAMIGAGSIVFAKTLAMDILATPALGGSELRLMSRTRPKLDRMEAFLKRVIRENDVSAQVRSTLGRREALDGADAVIVMIQVGGLDAFQADYEVPLQFGVDQCIGDSLGPGGVFRGLRTIPVLVDILQDMEELCPGALLLNYANPMAACCYALGRRARRVQFIGLCHGVQTTLDLISRYVGVPKHQIDFLCAGINHMAWFLSLVDKRTGEDLYPMLRRNIEKPEYYANEKVRCEVVRQFGYFMTESSGHLSEYVPWFRSSRRALELYCDEPGFGGESGAAYKGSRRLAEKYRDVDYLESESTRLGARSVEYGSYILEARQTDRVFRLNGNVRNDGFIANLPRGCCVEVPIFVDRGGVHPVCVGDLPPPVRGIGAEQRQRAGTGGGSGPDGRPGAHCACPGPGPAHRGLLHLGRDPTDGGPDAGRGARVAPAVRRQGVEADANRQHPARRQAGGGAAGPGPGHCQPLRGAGRASDPQDRTVTDENRRLACLTCETDAFIF